MLDSYGWVDKDAGVVRIPIDDAMRLTVERGLPRGAAEAMKARLAAILVCATARIRVGAQMAGGPAGTGYKREAGMPSSALPAPLREIGFDQNIGQRLPLDVLLRDEDGRTVQIGAYFGQRPVVLIFAYYSCPMLCAQVINGLASALGVLSLEPGRDLDIVAVSFDPRDTPATAASKKAAYLERYDRPGAAAASHFLTADQPAIDAADAGGGLSLCMGRGDAAVRTPERRHRADTGRPARAIYVRHRVRPARPPARRRRGVGGQARNGRRHVASLLLPLRPDDGALRSPSHARAAPGGRPDGGWRSARSSSSWSGASARCPNRAAPTVS